MDATGMFQINEADLADLERTLPQISQELWLHLTPQSRTKFRRCQLILSRVRWNYGPPTDIHVVEDGDADGTGAIN